MDEKLANNLTHLSELNNKASDLEDELNRLTCDDVENDPEKIAQLLEKLNAIRKAIADKTAEVKYTTEEVGDFLNDKNDKLDDDATKKVIFLFKGLS